MTQHLINAGSVRAELRTLSRGNLLIIAERAAELVTLDQLSALLGDFVRLETNPTEIESATLPLLDDVREFYDAAIAGDYYETVEINNRGRQEQSEGTDAFVAEFDRLLHLCIHAADQKVHSEARASFELLFELLRHIDKGNDDVLFFADDGSSLDVGVNWRAALPAYFRCLAETSSPEEYARNVGDAIEDLAKSDRPQYLIVARNVANGKQRIALDVLVTTRK